MRARLCEMSVAGVLLAATAVAQPQSDLSGVWQLNKEKSHVESAMAWAKIDLTSTMFAVVLRTFKNDGQEEAYNWRFALDSLESSNQMHGAPMKSHVEREADALVVRSVTMFGSDALKTVDRWSLSDAGKTLTLDEKHQYAAEPEGSSLFVFERRPISAWPESQTVKLAGESYKNIQILKDLPAERLPGVMASFSSSLGVNCTHCHAKGDFANDSVASKQTARRMWTMAATINRDSFAGAGMVTCWTCHRGSVKPESQPK
jgi:hypothetical protein